MIANIKRRLILVGPLPPPYHGQSVSFNMLAEHMAEQIDTKVINLTGRNMIGKGGKATIGRAKEFISIFYNFLLESCKKDAIIYITIAQSWHGFLRDLYFIWIGRAFGNSIVVHLKGGNYDNFYSNLNCIQKFFIRVTLRRVEKILVLGKSLIHMFDFDSKLKAKVYVVENGLPYKQENTNLVALNKTREKEDFKVLFLSNMIESKGYLDVIKAASILVHENNLRYIKFIFAGKFLTNTDDVTISSIEQARENFFRMVSDLSLSENVEYRGVVHGDEKIDLFSEASLFILPTNYNNEGQPVSIIEAISFGLPIISTQYRAIPDMLTEGLNGFFVDYSAPDQIANQILKLHQDKDLRSKFSRNSFDIFHSKFTCHHHIDRIKKHLGVSR